VFVRLLGELEVEVEGEQVALPPGKPRGLFAWLAIHPGLHPRRALAGRLWPEVLDSSARASLRSALWALRSALGPAAFQLEATRERVGLAAEVRTDLGEFERLLAAGDRTGAVDLCRGRLLSDLDDEWVLEAREELERELSGVLAELATEADSGEDRVAAVRWARRRLAIDPLAQELGRPDMSYACLINASVSAACNGEFERSLAFADKCRTIVRAAGLAPLEANALAARCHILVRLGRVEEANASATAETALAERLDDPALSAMADHDRGMASHAAGDHERAVQLLGATLERDPPVSRPLARLARAESLVALERLDEAEAELRATALEPLGAGDFPDTLVARLARVQGLIALARDEHTLATKRLEEAARTWRRRAGAERPGVRYMAVLADFGRPPVVGLIEPRRELERVEAELAALRETQPTTTP
jgi:tetratricopeptide (TPR) repeat protein